MRLFLVTEEVAYPGADGEGLEIQLESEQYVAIIAADTPEEAITIGRSSTLLPAHIGVPVLVHDLGDAGEQLAGYVYIFEGIDKYQIKENESELHTSAD